VKQPLPNSSWLKNAIFIAIWLIPTFVILNYSWLKPQYYKRDDKIVRVSFRHSVFLFWGGISLVSWSYYNWKWQYANLRYVDINWTLELIGAIVGTFMFLFGLVLQPKIKEIRIIDDKKDGHTWGGDNPYG
jgi:Sec-independent protein secretion pathway component TatC